MKTNIQEAKQGRRFLACTLTIVLMLSGCVSEGRVETGDLLFVGLPMDYSLKSDTTIDKEEGINYIHTAILEVDENDDIWVIDATLKHGVDRHPLDTFLRDFTLRDGSLPSLEVLRLKDNSNARYYVEQAKAFLGEPYDCDFSADNGKHYCTELVYDSYIQDGKHLFSIGPMDWENKNGHIPAYWTQLFSIIGSDVPQGVEGTNPATMYNEPVLRKINTQLK